MRNFTKFENKTTAEKLIQQALQYKQNPWMDKAKGQKAKE
jgi:N-succinyl-L-ornithine transcarbamylase